MWHFWWVIWGCDFVAIPSKHLPLRRPRFICPWSLWCVQSGAKSLDQTWVQCASAGLPTGGCRAWHPDRSRMVHMAGPPITTEFRQRAVLSYLNLMSLNVELFAMFGFSGPWGCGRVQKNHLAPRKNHGIVVCGPPCSLYVWVSRGTHKRCCKSFDIFGDVSLKSVRMANCIVRNFVSQLIIYSYLVCGSGSKSGVKSRGSTLGFCYACRPGCWSRFLACAHCFGW